jgi:hypothetical protein
MARTRFRTHASLRRSLTAIVVALAECAVSTAYGAGSAHWQDEVAISGSPAASVTAGQAYSFTPSATTTSRRTLVFAITNMPRGQPLAAALVRSPAHLRPRTLARTQTL